jgi:hypothetical protein
MPLHHTPIQSGDGHRRWRVAPQIPEDSPDEDPPPLVDESEDEGPVDHEYAETRSSCSSTDWDSINAFFKDRFEDEMNVGSEAGSDELADTITIVLSDMKTPKFYSIDYFVSHWRTGICTLWLLSQ